MTSHRQRPLEAVGEAVDFMNYLRQTRSRVLLISFLLFASLAAAFPALDLRISGLFFDGRTFLQNQWWQNLLKDGLGYFIGLSFAAVIFVYLRNRLQGRRECRVNGRCVAYLLIVGIVGAGLIGAFSGYDFTQLSSMDAKSAFKMLAFAALAGVITEACRRRTL